MNKTLRIIGVIILAVIVFNLACFLIPHKAEYDTENEFRQAGGITFFDIPDNADECYYSIFKSQGKRISYVSFSLDSDSSKIFVKKCTVDDFIYTSYETGTKVSQHISEAKGEMENESEHNDIIRNCKYFGKDKNIGEYTLLWYNPEGLSRGTPGFALLVDEENNSFVWYEVSNFF